MTNKPKTKEELKKLVEKHFKKKCYDLNDIDTSEITDMSWLFKGIDHNFNIESWNTENVKNMASMFNCCIKFNSNIEKWNTRNVENMSCMFYGCLNFNRDISGWNIEKVTDMADMFVYCYRFNQDLSRWCMRNKGHSNMFYDCPIKEERKPSKHNILYE